ncbi:hypothetical protein BHU09_08090 [Tannerella sp. oral taxon 808]|nr:hypothetical protein BHU09_08090 [Tannerella sp. oral taxon 808]
MLTGCHTTRTAVRPNAQPAPASEAEYLREVRRQARPGYRTLAASLEVTINPKTKDEMSSRARLKVIRGQRLQISITPLVGIEMFRIEVSRDSLKVIDRLGRRYLAEPIEKITKEIPTYYKRTCPYDFRYEHLEALLTNRLFMPDGSAFDLDRFDNRKRPFGYRLFTTKDAAGVSYDFSTDNHVRLIDTEIICPFVELHWSYSRFRTIGGRPFPMDMEAEVDEHKKLSIEFNNVDIDAPVEMSFPIPNKYQRIVPKQLWLLFDSF